MWSAVLEVVLGLSFLFFVLSLICSAANEAIAALLAGRANTLARGVGHLLDGEAEADRFYQHPLIQALYRPGRRPSYIPSEKFALAVVDLYLPELLRGAGPQFANVRSTRVRETFELLWLEAAEDAATFRESVEKWFDDTMERVSGWYRRRTQLMLFAAALVVTGALNVNTLGIAQRLWTDPPLRAAVAEAGAAATTATTTPGAPTPDPLQRLEEQYRRLEASKLPLGWSEENTGGIWWTRALGWLITVLAISLGAPFWFDVLSKASRLRAAGDKPEESK